MADHEPAVSASFRELFELSPDAILVYLAGMVVQANPAAVQLLRAPSLAALIGRPSRELIAPECLPAVAERARALQAGEVASTRGEEVYLRLDGTPVHVEATAARAVFSEQKAFIVFLRDITDRKLAQERLDREHAAAAKAAAAEAREGWLRELIDRLPLLVFARDAAGRFLVANRRTGEFYGTPAPQMIGKTLAELGLAQDPPDVAAEDAEILRTGDPLLIAEREVADHAGQARIVEGVKVYMARAGGGAVVSALTDLTARRRLEDQLLHAQKMEALGRLAGGVAHDFNNLLTVIVESVDHLSDHMRDEEGDLQRVREAATRAALLTRQLLAFARQAPARPRVTRIDELVGQVARLLGRVLGEDIRLVMALDAPGACANVDPAQLELVVMNVAFNARDAMPNGGELALSTRTTVEAARAGAAVTECIVIELRDTGVGMDEDTRRRALDPFFTTKPLGVGTGLGLSTSYGVVEQLGGRIEIASALGAGTTVRAIVPTCAPLPLRPRSPSGTMAPATGLGTVLVLEDEAAVRRATTRMLRSLGYAVLDAALPSEAITVAREHAGPIDALLTDVVMPEMNGFEAARVFRGLRPDAAVLFVSGYSHDVLTDGPAGAPELRRLDKPFTKVELAEALRAALAERNDC